MSSSTSTPFSLCLTGTIPSVDNHHQQQQQRKVISIAANASTLQVYRAAEDAFLKSDNNHNNHTKEEEVNTDGKTFNKKQQKNEKIVVVGVSALRYGFPPKILEKSDEIPIHNVLTNQERIQVQFDVVMKDSKTSPKRIIKRKSTNENNTS